MFRTEISGHTVSIMRKKQNDEERVANDETCVANALPRTKHVSSMTKHASPRTSVVAPWINKMSPRRKHVSRSKKLVNHDKCVDSHGICVARDDLGVVTDNEPRDAKHEMFHDDTCVVSDEGCVTDFAQFTTNCNHFVAQLALSGVARIVGGFGVSGGLIITR